jgi:glycosyltransferase involved in cell wall biosynthesis
MKDVIFLIPNLTGSGAEKNTLRIANYLKEEGFNVKVILLENTIYHEIPKNLEVIALTKTKDLFKPLGSFGDFLYFLKLKKYLTKDSVLFSSLPRADRVAKFFNGKKYFIIRMSYKEELNKFSKKRAAKKLKLYRKIYKDENLITVAKAIKKDLDELNIKYNSVKTIYNPFDFDEIRKKADEKIDIKFDYIISPNAFRVQKRYDVLLDAFKLVKSNIKLLILAKEDKKLQKMIDERGLSDKAIVLGFKKNPYPYIKNAKLTVLSSDREGLPTVLIESLILNTPVVSTNCPTGPSEILTNELSKWLVPVGDSKTLAQKIDEALNSKIEIKEKYLNKFHKDFIIKEYKRLIDE